MVKQGDTSIPIDLSVNYTFLSHPDKEECISISNVNIYIYTYLEIIHTEL